jgi:hypothetical protein
MNEIDDLLERIETPPTDVSSDVSRGERALQRRRRYQVSGAVASVVVAAATVAALQGAGGPGSADAGFAGQPGAPSPTSSRQAKLQLAKDQQARDEVAASKSANAQSGRTHHQLAEVKQRMRQLRSQLGGSTAQKTLQTYHDVLAAHLDPAGNKLRLAQNEQGGTGHFGTKLDWGGGGMLQISVSTSWRTSEWDAYPPAPGHRITFRGHPARVLVDGGDVWVAVEHSDGQVVMLVATPEFGNNGTSIPATGLTSQQLLNAAADPKLQLPANLR